MRQDRLLFAFLLSCQLMVEDGRLDPAYLSAIPPLWELAGGGGARRRRMGRRTGTRPELPWLRRDKWEYFGRLEAAFPEDFGGLRADMVQSSSFWLVLHDAKEPDNLPLKEPWYSSLAPFLRLVLIGALRC